MYSEFLDVKTCLDEVTETCNGFVEALNQERKIEEEKRQQELLRKQEEEERKRQEEEMRLKLEQLRLEEEKKKKEEEERIRKEQEEQERQRRIAEEKARDEARRRMEAEEEERNRQEIIRRQKALAESIRQQREAEKKAAEEAKRQALEKAEAEAEAAWNAALESEACVYESISAEVANSVEGVEIDETGLWTLLSVQEFESILHQDISPNVCVYWLNQYSTKSKENLQLIQEHIPFYPSIRFLCVNTGTFPQLPFQYGAQISTVQCFIKGTQVFMSTTSTVMETIQSFYDTIQTHRIAYYFDLFHDFSEYPTLQDNGFTTAISAETFGSMRVSEKMKKDIKNTVEQLREACPDAGAFQQAIHLWNVILKNILKNPQDERYARIRMNNDKVMRLTG